MATRKFIFGDPSADLRPIGDLLTAQAQRNPDRPAVTLDGETVTISELDRRANRRARALAELGVQQEDFVSIVLPNCMAFHEVSFALWKLGATPAPISPQLPEAELQPILDLTSPRLVIGAADKQIERWTKISHEPPPDHLSDAPLETRISKYWKATTSGGSTGRPKVIVDHSPGTLDPSGVGLGLALNDTVLSPGPLYHNAPFGLVHRAICRGAHIIEMTKFDAEEALRLIERHKVRWAYLVPTMMHRICSLPEAARLSYDLSSLEMVVHMAGPCPEWLKEKWIDWLGPEKIWEVYAGTERSGATNIGGSDWLTHRGSVGRAAPGFTIEILGEAGEVLKPGEVGEIFFRSIKPRPPSFHYLGATPNERGDAKSYGDIGRLDEDGFLYLADRRVDMIVAGGANIFPAEVEAAISAFRGVASCVVVGLPSDDFGQRAHAIIQREGGAVLDAAALAKFLDGQLVRYKHPYTYELVSEPLHNDAGKVRRSQLRDERIEQAARGVTFPRLRERAT